jgi:hypothetical protein
LADYQRLTAEGKLGEAGQTAFGAPALRVREKLLACVPVNRSAEPGSLMVRVGLMAAPNCSQPLPMFTT